jgi:hypothetical protein
MSKVAEGWEPSRETEAQPSDPCKLHGLSRSDASVPGRIIRWQDLAYARRVATAYYMRYAPEAYRQGTWKCWPASIRRPEWGTEAATLRIPARFYRLYPPMNMHPYFTALVIFAVVVVLLGIAVVAVLMSGSDRLYPPDDREDDED